MLNRLRVKNFLIRLAIPFLFLIASSGCLPQDSGHGFIFLTPTPTVTPVPTTAAVFPQRPHYTPGELVSYTAQSGDTLPALSVRFNTTVDQILTANPSIPVDVTTLPPGMPMQIPIYYMSLWGPSYQIIPDSLFVDGPAQSGFDTQAFIANSTGWLRDYSEFAFDGTRTAGQIIDYIAINYSISPRLLLALLDYQSGGLSLADVSQSSFDYPLGYRDATYKGLYMQLNWAANILNNGYYGFRIGQLTSFMHLDGTLEKPDPWQNAGTVALQFYFSILYDYNTYLQTVSEGGLARTYRSLFGDPWSSAIQPLIPGNLSQPEFTLPFMPRQVWAFTGGPHTNWGSGDPLASLDFAPPSMAGGCVQSTLWVTAVASGEVVRTDEGIVVLDLNEDGDEKTGWVVFYLHIATQDRVTVGTHLTTGDLIGHPSCEGGEATGTHVHIARKYNGEWIPATGILAFDLDGWIANAGAEAYQGTLVKGGQVVTACTCSDPNTHIEAGK